MKLRNVAVLALLTVSACALPDKPVLPAVYDLGLVSPVASEVPLGVGSTDIVIVTNVSPNATMDALAVWYRLAYADAQQLRAYAHARWSLPPAQLLEQRLRARLGASRVVVSVAQATALRAADASKAWQLQLDLEEFSQVFITPQQSNASLRLRATVTHNGKLLGQRVLQAQTPAKQGDAAAGIQALAVASDQVVDELRLWLSHLAP